MDRRAWGLQWVTGGYSGVTESDTAEHEHRHACDTEHLVVGNEHRQITSQKECTISEVNIMQDSYYSYYLNTDPGMGDNSFILYIH